MLIFTYLLRKIKYSKVYQRKRSTCLLPIPLKSRVPCSQTNSKHTCNQHKLLISSQPHLNCTSNGFYFLLPMRANSSALDAALARMSWFLARSIRTLRMLVGTSRESAKRDPWAAFFVNCGSGREALAFLIVGWKSGDRRDAKIPLRLRMLTVIRSPSAGVSSSSSSRRLWLLKPRGWHQAQQGSISNSRYSPAPRIFNREGVCRHKGTEKSDVNVRGVW